MGTERAVSYNYLTSVTSREAAAALMCRLGCFTELEQSRARANVPTDLPSDTGPRHTNLDIKGTVDRSQRYVPPVSLSLTATGNIGC